MSDADDPLLAFLHGELEQIEDAVGFSQLLPLPTIPLEASHGESQTLSWSYRFTWQEVERSRRYVLPLDRERARAARRPAVEQIVRQLESQLDGEVAGHALPVGDVRRRVSLNAILNVYAVQESIDVGPLQPWPPPTTQAGDE